MKKTIKQWGVVASLATAMALSASPAQAVYNIVLAQSGVNVVATGSGSISTAGLTASSTSTCGPSLIQANNPTICTGSGTGILYLNAATSSPANFGTGSVFYAGSQTGDAVFVAHSSFYVKQGYVSGSALSGTSTWVNTTLAGLGVAVGTYTWSLSNGDSIVLYAGTTPASTTPQLLLPLASGIGATPTALDLSTLNGPKIVSCLMTTINQLTGSTATYQSQQMSGAATVSLSNGNKISFYPLTASTSTGSGISNTGSNVMNVATSCGSLGTAPAAYNLTEISNSVSGMSGTLQVSGDGVLIISIGNQTLVTRPDYIVTSGGSKKGLVQNADGSYSMNYADGSVQLMRPAFLDPAGLQVDATSSFLGQLAIQLDGTAMFTQLNGAQMTWTPEYLLSPTSLSSPVFVNDATNHYKYRIAASYQGMSSR